jgi:hypothetical protein
MAFLGKRRRAGSPGLNAGGYSIRAEGVEGAGRTDSVRHRAGRAADSQR